MLHQFTSIEFTEVINNGNSLTYKTRMDLQRSMQDWEESSRKISFLFISVISCPFSSLLFLSWKGSLRWNNLSLTKSCLLRSSWIALSGVRRSWQQQSVKVQWLPQKFTSCCVAQDMRMLHIKMLISNAVQKIIQTNRNGEFTGQVTTINYPGFQRSLAVL